MTVSTDEAGRESAVCCELAVNGGNWCEKLLSAAIPDGVHALYFAFSGEGTLEMKGFSFFG